MTWTKNTLGVDLPVLAAPMAGGPSSPDLVEASIQAGSSGFLAGGYKTAAALHEQIQRLRSNGAPFGVNLFAPNPVPVDGAQYRSYAQKLQVEADQYDLTLNAGEPLEDDDAWADKVDLLTTEPVPWVSFTFGIPDRDTIAALQNRGTLTLQSVTSAPEARAAVDAGIDAVIVQAHAAGGHSATLSPGQPIASTALPVLVNVIRQKINVPIIAAGGIAGPDDVAAAIHAGADAVMVGTMLLRANESGASPAHQAALVNPEFTETVLTTSFTGRPARALRNYFIDRYEEEAPSGYPALHHLTSPLRKAATAAGDTRLIHLWAGTGFGETKRKPASEILQDLVQKL